MADLTFLAPASLHTPVGYSHAVVSGGPTVHVAGQVALDAGGQLVGRGDFAVQAEQALVNVELALAAAGADFASVASLTIYVTADVPRAALVGLSEPLRRRFDAAPPAITLLIVQGLMNADWLVEVQAVASAEPT